MADTYVFTVLLCVPLSVMYATKSAVRSSHEFGLLSKPIKNLLNCLQIRRYVDLVDDLFFCSKRLFIIACMWVADIFEESDD